MAASKKSTRRGAKRKSSSQSSIPKAKIFGALIGCIGLFAGIVWLSKLPPIIGSDPTPDDQTATVETSVPTVEQEPEVPQIEIVFYDELADETVEVDVEIAEQNDAPKQYNYVLQAASFRNLSDADALRASLTLKGLDVSINTVVTASGTERHRIIVGPYQRRNDVDTARKTLINEGLEPLVLRREREST